MKALILATLLPGLSVLPVPLQANPYGPNVVAGGANFQGLGTANLNVNQTSNTAIINWQGFSIANGEVTTFNQPGVNSVALNRVVSGNPSAIYGALNANGSIIVVNPNGIVVGPTGVIDVAGMLTMSTLDIDDDDFLDGGSNRFQGNTGAGITNYGAVSSSSGDVVFLGNFLQNAGSVSAPDGTVAFGSGGDILVEQGISGATISVQGAGPGGAVGIDNSGKVNAAAVEFKTTGNAYGLAIQNTGVVRATGASVRGGRVMLSAGSQGTIINTGTISARNQNGSGGQIDIDGGSVLLEAGSLDAAGVGGQVGGDVNVNASNIAVGGEASIDVSGSVGGAASLVATSAATLNGSVDASGSIGNGGSFDVTGAGTFVGAGAVVDVSGRVDGGNARIGGGFQGADPDLANSQVATVEAGSLVIADGEIGNAGTVVVWSDGDTTFNGEILARANGIGNGGFVEVSGRETLGFSGFVSTLSASGNNGTLLLDPTDVTIGAAAAGVLSKAALLTALQNGNVIIHTHDSTGAVGETGTVTIQNSGGDLFYNEANHLSIFAHGNVLINDNIQNAGTGNVNIFAGWDGTGADTFNYDPNTPEGFPGETAGDISFANLVNPDGSPGAFGDYGQNGGSVVMNPDALGEVAVGSAGGETNILGNVVLMLAGGNDEFTQVGFFRFGDGTGNTATTATGDINVRGKNTIRLLGNASGQDAHTMIGHGGSNASTQANATGGNVSVTGADISVIAEGGGIFMRGGHNRSFSQIGHGGMESFGDLSGDITVEGTFVDMLGSSSTANQNFAGVRIGHGGVNEVIGAFSGDIAVVADTFIRGSSGLTDVGGGGNENTPSGSEGDIVQIGHGGYRSGVVGYFEADYNNNANLQANRGVSNGANPQGGLQATTYNAGGNSTVAGGGVLRDAGSYMGRSVDVAMAGHTGAIHVEAKTGDVTLNPGSRGRGFAQIGHGGYQSHGNHNLTMVSDGSQTSAALKDGITVIAGTDVSLLRNTHSTAIAVADRTYVQIGLGGYGAAGRFVGDIDIQAGGFFRMESGEGNDAYSQVGHGGGHFVRTDNNYWVNSTATRVQQDEVLHADNGQATLSGDINIVAGGNIEAYSGSRQSRSYTMIGHGGYNRTADFSLAADATQWGHNGDINLDSGGDIIVHAKPRSSAVRALEVENQNWARVGHGGFESKGDHWGDITLNAVGDIEFHAGLGGYEEYNPNNNNYNSAQTGAVAFVQLGHGGFLPGLFRVGDTRNGPGSDAYHDNGNRGQNGIGNAPGTTSNITVTAGGDFELFAHQDLGNLRADQTTQTENAQGPGNVTVTRAPLVRANQNWAHVGHGGLGDANGARTINRTATTAGDISVTAGGTVEVTGGMLPQIDVVNTTGSNGNVSATIPGQVDYLEQNWAQIGHGGFNYETGYEGDISVIGGGDVTVQGGLTKFDFARIGHGGWQAGVNINGSSNTVPFVGAITVISTGGDINLFGGFGNNVNVRRGTGGTNELQGSYSQIGHGAIGRDMDVTGNITLAAGTDINLNGGFGDGSGLLEGERNLAAGINFGGYSGVKAGAQAAIREGYSHVGHGGMGISTGRNSVNGATNGNFTGDIDVTAGNDIFMTSFSGLAVGAQDTAARNWSKIGHGDTDLRERNVLNGEFQHRAKGGGIWNGDIFVKAGRNITTVAGAIGHADPLNNDQVTTQLDGLTRSLSGETFIAVGRNSAAPGSGVFTATSQALSVGSSISESRFSNAFLGLATDQLRFYTTDAAGNQIAEDTGINGVAYTRTPAPGSGRADEQIGTEHVLGVGAFGEPTGTFTPEGDYPGHGFGPYNVYYADATDFIPPPTPPTPPPPPFVPNFLSPIQQLAVNNLFNLGVAGELDQERERYIYYTDAYGNVYIIGMGLEDVVYEDDENYYYTFAEDALDSMIGNNAPGDFEIIEREEAEELLRRQRAASAVFGGVTFYTYNPDTNRYSSLRIFGVPQSNLGIIE